IRFGQTLELQVVAEGVETEAQRQVLIEAGIDLAQGYLFGKPVPLEVLVRTFSEPEAGPREPVTAVATRTQRPAERH
ncbi:MAG TPA: EAL domain-containing protein, partial [Thioalkalivibrio sp.]|nr:EAL domain-containing protein [Thioalkalivibrio sp.]